MVERFAEVGLLRSGPGTDWRVGASPEKTQNMLFVETWEKILLLIRGRGVELLNQIPFFLVYSKVRIF